MQRCVRDRHTQLAYVCEVGEAELAGLMGLAEDYLLLLAVDRPPGTDTTFQGTMDTAAVIRMTSEHLLEATRTITRHMLTAEASTPKKRTSPFRPASAIATALLSLATSVLTNASL